MTIKEQTKVERFLILTGFPVRGGHHPTYELGALEDTDAIMDHITTLKSLRPPFDTFVASDMVIDENGGVMIGVDKMGSRFEMQTVLIIRFAKYYLKEAKRLIKHGC